MTDMHSRTDFINSFSESFGCDSDDFTGLIISLDSVNGITSRCCEDEIYFSFVLDGIAFPLLTVSRIDGYHSAFLSPVLLKEFLSQHGVFPFEADGFLDMLLPFASIGNQDADRCYLDIFSMLEDTDILTDIIQSFMNNIYCI